MRKLMAGVWWLNYWRREPELLRGDPDGDGRQRTGERGGVRNGANDAMMRRCRLARRPPAVPYAARPPVMLNPGACSCAAPGTRKRPRQALEGPCRNAGPERAGRPNPAPPAPTGRRARRATGPARAPESSRRRRPGRALRRQAAARADGGGARRQKPGATLMRVNARRNDDGHATASMY